MAVSGSESDLSLQIRPATPRDYDGIVRVWSAAGLPIRPEGRDSKAAFLRQVGQCPDLYLVATDGERIVGVVFGSHDQRKGWINRLAVLTEYRRQGVAKSLVETCEAAIAAHGIEIIAALVEPDNAASGRFFEGLGYRTDVQVRYYRKLTHPDA